jgi:hypothetical protein
MSPHSSRKMFAKKTRNYDLALSENASLTTLLPEPLGIYNCQLALEFEGANLRKNRTPPARAERRFAPRLLRTGVRRGWGRCTGMSYS